MVVALAGLVGCADDGGSAQSGQYAAAKSAGVTETNRLRAMNGKPPVAESAMLVDFADEGAAIDFSGSPHQHFSQTSGGSIAFAENECPHWPFAAGGDMEQTVKSCIAAFYSEGPGDDYATHGHYINMMGDYGTLGMGIYVSGGEVTIIQDYGR
jgi:hypothetical protein